MKPECDTIKTTFTLITAIEETEQPLSGFATVLFNLISILFRIRYRNARQSGYGLLVQIFFFLDPLQYSKGNNYAECNIIKQTPYGVFL